MKKLQAPEGLTRKTIRLPASLYEKLEAAAKYNGHSVNTEMVTRLQATAVNDQFAKVLKEIADLKAINKELLDLATSRQR